MVFVVMVMVHGKSKNRPFDTYVEAVKFASSEIRRDKLVKIKITERCL